MNPDHPAISIITPTYNRAHVLKRSVLSVLSQTYQDFEYIIIDDGSKDDTTSLIQSIIQDHPQGKKIHYYIHKINQGQNAALNTGLSHARGEYVAFLDSDDEWLPQMLEEQMSQFLADKELDCSYTWAGIRNAEKQIIPSRRYSIKGYLYKEALIQGYICNPTTLMVKKKCFDALGGFKTDFITCQDDDICLRLAKSYKFGLVPSVQAIINSDAGNQTITNRRLYADDWHKLFKKYENDILSLCGKKVYAAHLNKCALLYVAIGDRLNAKRIVEDSLQQNKTLKTYLIKVLSMLPAGLSMRIYHSARNVKMRLATE